MKYALTLLALSSAFALTVAAPSTLAQTPDARRALAAEVVDLTAGENVMNSLRQAIVPMMTEMTRNVGGPNRLNEKQRAIVQREMDAVMNYVMGPEYMGKLRIAFADAFAKVYTEAELRAIRDFYRSPAGKAMVEKTPQAIQAAMPEMRVVMEKLSADMEARGKKLAAELEAAR